MNLIFDFAHADGSPRRQAFRAPRERIVARSLAEVRPALARVDAALAAGRWVAGYLAYEAAPAFDPACKVRAPADAGALPLLDFGVFDAPLVEATPAAAPAPILPEWRLDIDEAAFYAHIESIRTAIRHGEIYQANYTVRAHARLDADARDYYEQLRLAQAAGYCAFLDLGERQILSASPELFFRWEHGADGGVLTTRPMKGTAPRGRWPEEDTAIAEALYTSVKNRAENVMIVDLLRNDLSRVAMPGGVSVPQLFSIERYPTLFQMTSTVAATTRADLALSDIFAALFPCGSITGAPKIKAMEIIAAEENSPRGVYCGAVGFAGPQGAVFNVPIRTVTVDAASRAMTCGLGSGITWGSDAADEFAEVETKSRFLTRLPERFDLFETLLLQDAVYTLRARHLTRLTRSAESLGFAYEREALDRALYAYAAAHPAGRHRVRLVLARDGAVRIEGTPLIERDPAQVAVSLARAPVLREHRFLYHKTTRRACYDEHTAGAPDAFDVLLWNEDGELTEFTRGNVVVEMDGKRWTPPITCGLLPGTLRAELLAQGQITERVIHVRELPRAARVWFINSVRGWLPATLDAESMTRAQAAPAAATREE